MALRDKVLGTKTGYSLFRKVARGDRSMRLIMEQYICPVAGQTIVDLGCGTGDLAMMLPDDVTYVGVDHNPAYLTADAVDSTSSTRSFVNADLSDLDQALLPRTDTAVAIGVLHHLSDDAVLKLLRSTRRLLGEHGRLVTVDPVFWPSQPSFARLMMAMDRGRFVRHPEHYAFLIHDVFPGASMAIRHDLNSFPYSHAIFNTGSGRATNS